jgi:hypothetical protein
LHVNILCLLFEVIISNTTFLNCASTQSEHRKCLTLGRFKLVTLIDIFFQLLVALKVRYHHRITILRGNHESRQVLYFLWTFSSWVFIYTDHCGNAWILCGSFYFFYKRFCCKLVIWIYNFRQFSVWSTFHHLDFSLNSWRWMFNGGF